MTSQTTPLQRVTRWKDDVETMLKRHGLEESVEIYQVLAQIHTESRGWERPEDHLPDGAKDYSAEGLLQMQPIAAEDAGLSVGQIDGKGDPYGDALRSINAWGLLQRRYTGQNAPFWDYPLLWLGGSGTLSRAREYRKTLDYWGAWKRAADETVVGSGYLTEYAWTFYHAAVAYYQWQMGKRVAQ